MTISSSSIVTAAKRQVSCDLAGEVVILDVDAGVYYGLNAVGARVWSLLEQPRSVADIQSHLLSEYEVDPHVCEAQLHTLLADLAGYGLIEVVA